MVLLVGLVVGGCGSGSSGGSGAPASTKVSALTPAQQGALCDYINKQQGGYGKSVTCGADGTQENDPDQASCVAALSVVGSACPTLTAGDLEGCAAGPMGNVCTFATAPACANALACFSSL